MLLGGLAAWLIGIVGPKGGVITMATLRDATGWDQLVIDLGLDGLMRLGLRHTALPWMATLGPAVCAAAGRRPPGPGGDCPLSAPGYGRSGGGRQRVFGLVGAEWGLDCGTGHVSDDSASMETRA